MQVHRRGLQYEPREVRPRRRADCADRAEQAQADDAHGEDARGRPEAETKMRAKRGPVAVVDEREHAAFAARGHPFGEVRLEPEPQTRVAVRRIDVRVVGVNITAWDHDA